MDGEEWNLARIKEKPAIESAKIDFKHEYALIRISESCPSDARHNRVGGWEGNLPIGSAVEICRDPRIDSKAALRAIHHLSLIHI